MRKYTAAGVKAGVLAAIPLGVADAILLLMPMQVSIIRSPFNTYPNVLLAFRALDLVFATVFASLFGAIAGLIFVKTVNKLPFHSTYVKAVLPWVVLLVVNIFLTLILSPSPKGVAFFGLELRDYAFLVCGALLFAYLFNRWVTHQQPNIEPPTSY